MDGDDAFGLFQEELARGLGVLDWKGSPLGPGLFCYWKRHCARGIR